STYELALARNPENSSQAFLGASLAQSTKINDKIKIRYSKVLPFLFWFLGLIEMLIVLNLGIGLFNLLALGPLDGGRMLQLVLHKRFGIDKGNSIFQKTSLFFLFIIFIYLFVIFKNIVTFFV
ncbi:hypothetical protein HYX00_04975, partial [Candidatus Woesearchaeota archaeon]|nr:hypothetical protein [Candidatus Woesearchaeota archaeon]